MHLRRQVFPSPAVTTANPLNVATTCQSSTCTSSCFGRPVSTSVQANSTIRAIQPNTVKSRAQAFEQKDTDVRKEVLRSANTVVQRNSRFRTSASALSVNVTVDSSHLPVQQSKSDDHLEHTGVSGVPSVRLRDKNTKFAGDMEKSSNCQNPPSPGHRSVHQASSVGGLTHSPSATSSDIVTQRLQMFDNKPVTSNKPPRLPKPSSPHLDSGANRGSVYRSKSSDSVDTSSSVKATFHCPPGNRLQVHDNPSACISCQDAAQVAPNKSSDISNLHVDDVGARRKSAARQVREIVVVSPSSSGQVNKTGVANRPPSPSFTESSKIHLPKPRQMQQVREIVVVNPSSSSGQVNETGVANQPLSPPGAESSRILLPKASQKRQVKEIVVLNPSSSSGQVNETGVAHPPPSSSVTESSKILLPKRPPQKPQVRSTGISSPSPSPAPTNPPSSSCAETSRIVSPKPPEKPPRMAAASSVPAAPAHDDSYGLLVYAAGAATPSIRVEKLSPDADAPAEPPRRKMSGKRVADACSRLESHDEGSPTRHVLGSVLNTSRIQNSNALHTHVASQATSVCDAWDKKFIRAPKKTPVVSSKGKKENFVSKRRMNNPSYMYVSVHTDDIIISKQKSAAEKHTTLTRYHSDDMLNMIPPAPLVPNPRSPGYKEPVYAVPYEFTDNAAYTTDQVVIDSEGYAMPYVPNTPQFKVTACCYSAVTFYRICKVFFRT